MKFLNKLIVLSIILFLTASCFMIFAYNKLTDDAPAKINMQSDGDLADAVEAERNISSSAGSQIPSKQYILKLEGDLICAYITDGNGSSMLWNSTSRPLSLSPDDIKKLENGLYTSSFEELCLFFEAYAS